MSDHEKVYAVCENKCFVETMSKEQIEALGRTLDRKIEERPIKTPILYPDEAIVDIDKESSYRKERVLIYNKTDTTVTIKMTGEVMFPAGETVKVLFEQNGVPTIKTGTSSGGDFRHSSFNITLFTLSAGASALFEFFERTPIF